MLLIVAALDDARAARRCTRRRARPGLEALVEVHDRAELERALAAGARIVGVNNRDLRTMTVDLETALDLAPRDPRRRGGGGGERHPRRRATCARLRDAATTRS